MTLFNFLPHDVFKLPTLSSSLRVCHPRVSPIRILHQSLQEFFHFNQSCCKNHSSPLSWVGGWLVACYVIVRRVWHHPIFQLSELTMPSAYSTHTHTHTHTHTQTDWKAPMNCYSAVYCYSYEINLSCVVLLRRINLSKPSGNQT